MILPVEGDEVSGWKPGKPTVFLNSPAAELNAEFSPDGKWLAYESSESGRNEVYVSPFPGPRGKTLISNGGGVLPTWSRAKHELFYSSLDRRIMVASYTVNGDAFVADRPQPWSARRFIPSLGRSFDLHPDGERVALAVAPETPVASPEDKAVFVFHFDDELRRLAPATKR